MTDEIPMVAVVDCGLLGEDGKPAPVMRAMNEDEIAQREKDLAAVALAPAPARPPLERLADMLAAMPPDQFVTAADLLAPLKGEA